MQLKIERDEITVQKSSGKTDIAASISAVSIQLPLTVCRLNGKENRFRAKSCKWGLRSESSLSGENASGDSEDATLMVKTISRGPYSQSFHTSSATPVPRHKFSEEARTLCPSVQSRYLLPECFERLRPTTSVTKDVDQFNHLWKLTESPWGTIVNCALPLKFAM